MSNKVTAIVSLKIDYPKMMENNLGYLSGFTIFSGTTVSMLHITLAKATICQECIFKGSPPILVRISL